MSLNIKNPEVHDKIRQLAALKGLSMTAAVSEAVSNEIEREQEKRQTASGAPKRRSDYLLEFAEEFAKRVKHPVHSWEVDALLYGEDGLPR